MAENKKTPQQADNKKTAPSSEEKKTNKQRLKEITDSIETGIKELFQSDKYREYLQTMSRFHRYSVNNQMLIYMQKPAATHVTSFSKWRDQFGRNVKRGEKGIKIIAPTPYKKKIEETKLDPDTKLPMLDENGKVIKEEKEIQVPMYRVVSVFDVSQTEGKPLPQLVSDLSGNVQNYDAFVEAIRRSSDVPITFEPMEQSMDGYFSFDEQKIVIRSDMSEVQTVAALLHEMAHSKLHNTKFSDEHNPETAKISRSTEEVQAESIAFTVSAYYGIKTDENSLAYIALWSKDKELPELKSSLETINKTANKMITDIDRHFAEVKKERGLDNEMLDLDDAMFENSINYLHIQRTDTGWDYSVYDKDTLRLIDGGQIDEPNMKLEQIKEQITAEYEVNLPYGAPLPDSDKNRLLDDMSEKALSQMSADLPDPNITLADMNSYGYSYENMLPLTQETAEKLFNMDAAVYMLHYDDTEALVMDASEIKNFDGIFGIEKADWEKVKDNYLKNAEISTEDDYNTYRQEGRTSEARLLQSKSTECIDGIINNGDNRSTVSKLEEDVKSGKSISLLELTEAIENEHKEQKRPKSQKASKEKPSLLAKLKHPLPPQDKIQPKSKEREM